MDLNSGPTLPSTYWTELGPVKGQEVEVKRACERVWNGNDPIWTFNSFPVDAEDDSSLSVCLNNRQSWSTTSPTHGKSKQKQSDSSVTERTSNIPFANDHWLDGSEVDMQRCVHTTTRIVGAFVCCVVSLTGR